MKLARQLAVSCLIALSWPASRTQAALADPPHQTIHFLAEHLPEIAQDAGHHTLPWAAGTPLAGVWQGSLQAGYLNTASGFIDLTGPLLAAAAAYGLNGGWALEGMLFYGDFDIGDGSSDEVLWATFLAHDPLDLPESARFVATGGKVIHRGIGFGALHRLSSNAAARPLFLRFGLLFEQLEAKDFQLRYSLLGGRDVGAQGVLDHSFSNTYITPHLGLELEWPLGKNFKVRPRLSLGYPLPEGDFDARLTGPGFDLSSREPGGHPEQVGDPFVGLGAGFLHVPSGLEIDLGSTLYFGAFGEHLSHTSAQEPLLLQLTWHLR